MPCPAGCGYKGSCVRTSNDGHPKNKHLVPQTSWALEVWRINDNGTVKKITFDDGHVTVHVRYGELKLPDMMGVKYQVNLED